jgi:hypothetical protein
VFGGGLEGPLNAKQPGGARSQAVRAARRCTQPGGARSQAVQAARRRTQPGGARSQAVHAARRKQETRDWRLQTGDYRKKDAGHRITQMFHSLVAPDRQGPADYGARMARS